MSNPFRLLLVAALLVIWGSTTEAQIAVPGTVYAVDWSPDGSKVAIAGGADYCVPDSPTPLFDVNITIFSVETGDSIRQLEGARCKITRLHWSPDGSKIAALSEDTVGLHIWDAATGESLPVDYYENVRQQFHSLSWKPDSTQILVTYVRDNYFSGRSVATVDATGGQLRDLPISGYAQGAEWSPDGNSLLVGIPNDGLQIIDAVNGETRLKIYPASDNAQILAWSPDGEKFASAGDDQIIRIWNTADGTLLQNILTEQAVITDLAWNPTGSTIASAGLDKTVRVWDVETGTATDVYESTQSVYDLDWNNDGQKLIYTGATLTFHDGEGGPTGTFEIVDVPQNTTIHQTAVIAWKPDGSQIAVGGLITPCSLSNISEAGIWLLDSTTYQSLKRLKVDICSIQYLNWSADGTRMAVSDSQLAYVFDTRSSQMLFRDQLYYATNIQLTHDGNRLLISDAGGGGFAVISVRTENYVFVGDGTSANWSPDGEKLISVKTCNPESWTEGCGSLKVWDGNTGAQLQAIPNPLQHMNIITWNPNSQQFATGIATLSPEPIYSVQIWDAEAYELVKTFPISETFIYQIVWSPDDQIIATLHRDEGQVRLWNVDSGERLKVLNFPGAVLAAAWSPDGRQFAFGGMPDYQIAAELPPGCDRLLDNTLIVCEANQLLSK